MYASDSQKGFVWLPAFGPHVLGVAVTVVLAAKYFRFQWFYGAVGLTFIAISTKSFIFYSRTDFLILMYHYVLQC